MTNQKIIFGKYTFLQNFVVSLIFTSVFKPNILSVGSRVVDEILRNKSLPKNLNKYQWSTRWRGRIGIFVVMVDGCCVWRRMAALLLAPKPLLQYFLRLGPALSQFFHLQRSIFHPRIWLNSIFSCMVK